MSTDTAPEQPAAAANVPTKSAGTPAQRALKRVLVVDDEPTNIEYLNKVLTKAGYEPVQTQRAKDALLILAQEPIDLVLADIMMPEMDGIDMVRAIRKMPTLQELPIIMCTAANEREQVVAAAKHGIQGYLLKPINRQALLERMAEIFGAEVRATPTT